MGYTHTQTNKTTVDNDGQINEKVWLFLKNGKLEYFGYYGDTGKQVTSIWKNRWAGVGGGRIEASPQVPMVAHITQED